LIQALPETSEFAGLDFVDITPHPGFPWLIRANQRVLGLVEMFGGVFVLRRVAAPHMPALKAQAQVNPCVAGFHTVLAHVLIRLSNLDLIQVRALLGQSFLQRISISGQVTTVM
jgi:hypothetical protein